MRHYIGQNFTKSVTLDLLPFAELNPTMMYTVNMVYHDVNMYHSTSFQTMGIPPKIAVGPDVYSIQYEIVSLNHSNGQCVSVYGNIRVDRLILLNLAKQLLK